MYYDQGGLIKAMPRLFELWNMFLCVILLEIFFIQHEIVILLVNKEINSNLKSSPEYELGSSGDRIL